MIYQRYNKTIDNGLMHRMPRITSFGLESGKFQGSNPEAKY